MKNLKRWHILVFLLILATACTACRTPKQQAQRHLKKAIEKDPSIIANYTKDTLLFGIAKGTDTVYIKGTSSDIGFNCDSLQRALNDTKIKPNAAGEKSITVYTDSAKRFEVVKSKSGNLFARITTPADTIYKDVMVPYRVEVKVPGKLITKYESKPAYSYWWFWFMFSLIAIALYLGINRIFFKKDYVKTIFVKDEPNG